MFTVGLRKHVKRFLLLKFDIYLVILFFIDFPFSCSQYNSAISSMDSFELFAIFVSSVRAKSIRFPRHCLETRLWLYIRSIYHLIVWLNPRVGKMKQILCSDWLPWWAHPARWVIPTLVPEEKILFSDQACSVEIAVYWPHYYFAFLLTNIQPSWPHCHTWSIMHMYRLCIIYIFHCLFVMKNYLFLLWRTIFADENSNIDIGAM